MKFCLHSFALPILSFVLLSGLTSQYCSAQIHLEDNNRVQDIGHQLWLWRDVRGNTPIEKVFALDQAGAFTQNTGRIVNLGFNNAIYWLRLEIGPLPKSVFYHLLFSSSPHLQYFDLYYQDENGKWQVQKSGYAVPWEQRPVQYITPAFLLPPSKDGRYYLRMNNKSISFSLMMSTGRGFVWHNLNRFLFFGLVSGLFLFVIVNNLYFAYALRSRTHLIYSFLAVSYWLFAASYEGYWFLAVRYWDWYARHYSDIGYALISGLMIVMMPIYTLSFFKPPKNSVWHRLSYFFYGYFILQLFTFFDQALGSFLGQLGALLMILFALFLGGVSMRQQHPGAGYFVLAYLLLFCLTFMEVLHLNFNIPYLLPTTYTTLGALCEVFVLSYALAYKTGKERKNLIQEKEAILSDNLRLMKERNTSLEEKVAAKTEELHQANQELRSNNTQLQEQQAKITHQKNEIDQQHQALREAYALIDQQNREIQAKNQNLEQEVQASQKELIEYNQQLEQFAFITAHNLRGPVSRILGLGNLLEMPDNQPDEQALYLQKLTFTTRELDQIIRDLTTILEIRKNIHQAMMEVSLHEEVDRVLLGLSSEIEATHAQIRVEVALDVLLFTIRPYLYSILYNLVSNAIKYRQPQLPPQILIRAQWQEDELALSIRDNGMGIDLEQHEGKLFQLYKRFHFHVEGKGMGLFLVNSQVKALKGRIHVESRPGAGTCFTVFLPKRRDRSETASFLST